MRGRPRPQRQPGRPDNRVVFRPEDRSMPSTLSPALRPRLAGLACLVAVLLPALPGHAAPFDLVTAAEAQRDASGPAPSRTRSANVAPPADAAAPAIDVIEPQALGGTLRPPLRIEVAFKPAPDARIVPSTFRLLYGVLKIDLTDRITGRAQVRESGAVLEDARVPDGNHRFIVRVGDDKGRIGERELTVRVGAK